MKTESSPILWIVDGSSFVFRAYHAMPGLRSRGGVPTGAVYGFVAMIEPFIEDPAPEYMVVAFDSGEPTFREKIFTSYKANREVAPEDLSGQFSIVQRWLEAMGVSYLEAPGYEADDIIGTLSIMGEAAGFDVRILTGDKDLLQLVTERTHVIRDTPGGRTDYDPPAVRERYNLPPKCFPDLLGLVGDTSDNIPGVPMIGEKTGISLLEKYGSLEGLYEHADEIGGKRGESRRESKDRAFLSRELATVRMDVPLGVDLESLRRREVNIDALRTLYEELDFTNYLRKMDKGDEPMEDDDYDIVDDVDSLRRLATELRGVSLFALDTETTSTHAAAAKLVGISISAKPGKAYYVPVRHLEGKQIPLEEVLRLLGPVLADPKIGKVGHNIKYDEVVLRRAGFDLAGIEFDTILAACLVEETGTSLSLENLSRKFLSKKKLPSAHFFAKGKTIDQASIESAGRYACRDADVTLLLRDHYAGAVAEGPNRSLFYDIDMPLSSVLADMELAGVKVLPEILERQSRELGTLAAEMARKVFEEVGEEFNLDSPQQLATILHDRLGLLSGRKRSTRADILERLANEGHTFAKDVLEYRHLKKLKSTYLDALPQLIHPETGRVHTSYSQTRAVTGRISSSDPNLQNIPIRSELGKRIREAFVPEKGRVLLSADYSQIELRVVAHYTEDPGLVGAFARGEDVHRRTAADISGVPIDEVTPEQRNRAKAINFGLHYGMTEHGLAERLGISVEEARDYMNRYFDRYPSVRTHIQRTINEATKKGFVTTLLGRRIDVSGLNSPNRNVVQNARRAAINAPIQGTAADMLKRAMVGIVRRLKEGSFKSRMILTVHDEVILETPEAEVDEVTNLTVDEMKKALPLSVPVEVNTKFGFDWASLG